MRNAKCPGLLILSMCFCLGALPVWSAENFEIGLTGLYNPAGEDDMTAELSINVPLFLGFSGRIAGGITAASFDTFKESPFDRYQFLPSAETEVVPILWTAWRLG